MSTEVDCKRDWWGRMRGSFKDMEGVKIKSIKSFLLGKFIHLWLQSNKNWLKILYITLINWIEDTQNKDIMKQFYDEYD